MRISRWLMALIAVCVLASGAAAESQAGGSVPIDAAHFPDSVFRAFLADWDLDGDGVLSADEIGQVTVINAASLNISDLTGIECFPALERLDCYSNRLTALDVSRNAALQYLDCGDNQLAALDVSQNAALAWLSCGGNQLTALDVSRNTALKELYCYLNQLTALDVRKNTALECLGCYGNQLAALDVSQNAALRELDCGDNRLTALDVRKNAALTHLSCSINQLTALDLSQNAVLKELSCYLNQLTALDVRPCADLVSYIQAHPYGEYGSCAGYGGENGALQFDIGLPLTWEPQTR